MGALLGQLILLGRLEGVQGGLKLGQLQPRRDCPSKAARLLLQPSVLLPETRVVKREWVDASLFLLQP